jgi:hypothetical protein
MLPVFTLPFALAGLAALPALAAIYWLRNRFRRYPVSSLMLWADHRQMREGGTKRHRLQTPFVFYLELLALLLLAVAAAGPHIQTAPGARPLIAVLDDSYSMTAGGADSPRDQAMDTLVNDIKRHRYSSVRFLLAGESPQILGEPVQSGSEAERALAGWKCRSSRSRIDEALALATELAGDRALILVVTDHKPDTDPGKGRLQWRAFGAPRSNMAFVNVARVPSDDGERCLLEVANYSERPQSNRLRIRAAEAGQELHDSTMSLSPGEVRRFILDLKPGLPMLTAQLERDELVIDDTALLFSTAAKPVRVDVQVQNKVMRDLIERAFRATPGTELTNTDPHVFVTDRDALRPESADAWVVRLILEKEAEAYTGPFVMDRSHPLTQGLDLQGVVWGGGKAEGVAGAPVIMAGNVPLVTDAAAANDFHEIRIRFKPELSTLAESPNWPVFFWNLAQWRAAALPGLSRVNVRLGADTVLTLRSPMEAVEVTTPSGIKHTQPVQGRQTTIRAEEVGEYQVRAGSETFAFAVHTANGDESDLRDKTSGRWGDWLDETTLRLEYQNIAWALLILVLCLLTLHAFLIARNAGKGRT